MNSARQNTRYKTQTKPVRISNLGVDGYIKATIERCAKARNVSMNKVINDFLDKHLPEIEAQAEMFENMKKNELNQPEPSFPIGHPDVTEGIDNLPELDEEDDGPVIIKEPHRR